MQELDRQIYPALVSAIQPGKAVILTGARRTGKTRLLKKMEARLKDSALYLNGDAMNVQEAFARRTVANYTALLGGKTYLLIDEAQNIPDIGKALKLIIDELPSVSVMITGSSAFDIGNKTGEPLTGRKKTFHLYPFSEKELAQQENVLTRKDNMMKRLIYGSYPELFQYTTDREKAEYLCELVSSYLLKDILAFEGIRNSGKILQLLKLIALQTGKEVSLNEISRQLKISKNTVERYLDIIEKSFVIFRLGGYSGNLRKEVTKHSKWYFTDNGLRNALVNNFNDVNSRNDTGELWENYIISERIKQQHYSGVITGNYFWRTYDGQEIDLIEQREGSLFAFEIKWKKQQVRIPGAFRKNYPDEPYMVITPENYYDWLEVF